MGVKTVIRVCIVCDGSFEAREIDARRGCAKYCGRKCLSESQRREGLKRFIESVATTSHTYLGTPYKNNKTKVQLECVQHGIFWCTPDRFMHGHHCPKCGRSKASENSKGPRKTTEQFIAEAREHHGDRYRYTNTVYNGAFEKVEVECNIHGQFRISAANHLQGGGCQECGRRQIGDALRSSRDEFIYRASETHDNLYSYELAAYKTAILPIEITCKFHGSFWQRPFVHLKGSGCPKCSHRISKPESRWLDSLGLELIRQYQIMVDRIRIRVDGFHAGSNTVYQFHGDYYHGNPDKYPRCGWNHRCKKLFGELYDRTIRIDNTIRCAGYNLVTMWESDWIKGQHEVLQPSTD